MFEETAVIPFHGLQGVPRIYGPKFVPVGVAAAVSVVLDLPWIIVHMTPDDFKRIVNNPHFISGIYNYCDRWCERCRFTERCSVYATSEAAGVGEGQKPSMKKAIAHTAEMFKISFQMLEEQLKKEGIDLSDIRRQVQKSEKIPEPPDSVYCRSVKKYVAFVNAWFNGRRDTFHRKGLDLAKAAEMGSPDTDPLGEVAKLRDAVDVIRWYQHLIYVKLRRASRVDDFADIELEGDDDPEMREIHEHDSNASAKIALIGIDNSMVAWKTLAELLPSRAAEIRKTVISLERLRNSVEKSLPNARAFKRPGFDDMPKRAAGKKK